MSKFNEVLQKQIERKAKQEQDRFWKEFEDLLQRNGIDRDVMFDGLKGRYSRPEDRGEQWRERLAEIFVGREAEQFVQQLNRFENYFKDREYF